MGIPMQEDKHYKPHLLLNGVGVLATVLLAILLVKFSWNVGPLQTMVNVLSLAGLSYSYWKIQYHELRTLVRFMIAVNLLCLFVASSVAYL